MYNPNHGEQVEWGDKASTIPVIGTHEGVSDLEHWEDYSLQKWGIMFEGMPPQEREQYRQHIPPEWWGALFDED